jgi:hypothetical protein
MTVANAAGLLLAVCSAWLGGSLGAATLAQANAAPLSRTATASLGACPAVAARRV